MRGFFWLPLKIIPAPDCRNVDENMVPDTLYADMIRSSVVLGLVIVSLTG